MALNVYRNAVLVGRLDMLPGEAFYGFAYDPVYLKQQDATPLSLSLPLVEERYAGHRAYPYFEGLLPEGDVRRTAARQFHISSASAAQLIRVLGRDCADDVVILDESDELQPPVDDWYAPLEQGLDGIDARPLQEVSGMRAEYRLSLLWRGLRTRLKIGFE